MTSALPLDPATPPANRAISVSELARQVRRSIEQAHPLQWVAGEISGFTRATSGHWYFSLKDSSAQVRCAMFRGRNQWLDWQPRNGDAVEARALPTLYEARGEFQLVVENLRPAGQGALYEAFARLRQQLELEGLFDPARKRPLPSAPRAIGVITSPAAAALRDVLSTLRRRAPQIPVILYPSPVQGSEAPAALLAALRAANRRDEVDVLILCRGGGSIEDLWAFNDEALARALASSALPVVSGVGHETDFTIADFAADMRAPTPTAAAELCAPPRQDQLQALQGLQRRLWQTADTRLERLHLQLQQRRQRLRSAARRQQDTRSWALDRLGARLVHPGQALHLRRTALEAQGLRLHKAVQTHVREAGQQVAQQQQRLQRAWQQVVRAQQVALAGHAQALKLLDPGEVLARGYSLTYLADGRLVRSVRQVVTGDALTVVLGDGRVHVQASPTGD